MNDRDWPTARLENVASLSMGQSPPSSTVNQDGSGMPFVQGNAEFGNRSPRAVKYCSKPKKQARQGDILLSVRAPVGALNLADRSLCIGRGLSAITATAVEAEFLWHALHQSVADLSRVSQGSTFTAVSKADLAGLEVPLPSLGEQRKIAAILSSVDNAIEKTQAVVGQIQVVKQGLMQELLTRGLPGQHKRFKKTVIGEIPEDWVVSPIGDLGQEGRPAIKAGPFGSSLKKSYYVSEGYRVYGQEQVLAGDLSVGNYYIDEGRYRLLRSCEVRPGDVLLSLVGTFGEVIVVPRGVEPGIINPRLLRISLNPRLILPDFTCYWLRCGQTQKLLAAAAQGGTMGVLNAGIVRRLSLARPPLGEQAAIVATLRALDRHLDSETAAKASALRLKSALMSVLLTGELRVTPDPEPE